MQIFMWCVIPMQIFAKRASSEDSAFLWHQDAAYWPPLKSDTSAVNCWLAVVDVNRDNGCMRYIPGSHREAQLRRHKPGEISHPEVLCGLQQQESCARSLWDNTYIEVCKASFL